MNNVQPTESELEILQVLWQFKKATVRQVHEVLASKRDIGYTTTLKLMQIMTEKKLLKRDTNQRVHIYQPIIGQSSVEQSLMQKIKKNLFRGSTSQLVIGALSSDPISQSELQEIRDYLNSYEKTNHSSNPPKP
ncbi:BlaI/MecI/CopY family transcriptional regulator [Geofilum rubicundum]|uniref:Transcriptional repressor, BlaI/MecI family n=1 Tax=Geofilum rubicundum JCM 15548 TaxID=1236989 RepID=A0A0E9LPV9_9BACT|nr:BlaI/MecI/CopY family transcriptional regulator [Geofilum rubicundum]GAO27632.1 transcriptional repressor, BlaI/MecI family [Geofilum rubicundum JCM 15548]